MAVRALTLRGATAACLITSLLSGCIPDGGTYRRVDAPAARYQPATCGAYGPDSLTYYPYHEIFISVHVGYSFELGLAIPADTTVRLDGRDVRVRGVGRAGLVDVTLPLAHTKVVGFWNGSREFQSSPPITAAPDDFGPFTGESSGKSLRYHAFWTGRGTPDGRFETAPFPLDLQSGEIELPPMTINGESYGPQTLHFESRRWYGIEPINC
jgi:hypothetical protein